jgi:hypothetical protein
MILMTEKEKPGTLLIIGTGVLGGNVLDLLSWTGFDGHIVVAGRNERTLLERTNLSRIAAYNQERYPRITTRYLDLHDEDRSAETIATIKPDIIFNTASVQTYWRISTLPREIYKTLEKPGVGAWLPMHLSPAYRLMTAVRRTGMDPIVVNAAYPDAVNPILATRDLAPAIGIGNVMNVVPAVRTAAAVTLGAPVEAVQIRLVAHHYVSNRLPAAGDTGGAPFHLSVYWDGRDVTDKIELAEIFGLLPTEIRRTRGTAGMYVTASSALAVLTALRSPTPVELHAPGPNGLPGGYPVKISDRKVELDLPESCSAESAVTINEHAQVFDGVQSISPTGRVRLTELATETMDRELGHYCPEFQLEDCHELAAELRAKYLDFEATRGRAVSV